MWKVLFPNIVTFRKLMDMRESLNKQTKEDSDGLKMVKTAIKVRKFAFFLHRNLFKYFFIFKYAVDENIIGAPKMRYLFSYSFQHCDNI